MVWITLFGSLLTSIASGAVLGAALGATGLLILHFFARGATELAVIAVWNVLNEFTFSAVPLFILISDILLASGLSRRVYSALTPLLERIPGGLLHTNILVSGTFGAASGSSMAVASAVGSVAYPEMTRLGYRRTTVVASLAAGGTLGLLIPPSLSLVIYGALTDTSIGKLFVAGIAPGLLVAALFMGFLFLHAVLVPAIAPRPKTPIHLPRALWSTVRVWPMLLLMVAIMGSIIAGLATPTEAAGIGVITTVVVGFAWGDLSWRKLGEALSASTRTFASIGFVIVGAVTLGQSISVLGLPRELLESVTATSLSQHQLLFVVIVLYLFLGFFFEGLSLVLMTLPLVFPLMTGAGFDPVWTGVLITILVEIALITPPVGLNLFVLTAVTNQEVELGEAAKATVPYWILLLLFVGLITVFPGLVLYLPGLM